MENKRPTMKDPAEFALIKQIYFKDNRPAWEDLDPVERLDRMESKQRNQNKSSR
jgi:hypothetical protein